MNRKRLRDRVKLLKLANNLISDKVKQIEVKGKIDLNNL
jgi:hypothetical protein